MIRGLYTSATGMITQMNKMDVVTNNLANSDTTAYKKDGTIIQSFSEELAKRLDDPKYNLIRYNPGVGNMSLGVFVDEVYTDFSNGSFKPTNGKLDMAVSGEGFFVVETMDKSGNTVEKYTRDGSFKLSQDGYLVTSEGNRVLGQNGAISIPNGVITVSPEGGIYSNDEFIDTLKLTDFENKETLRKDKDNLYNTIAETNEKQFSGNILQGYLESSNVNIVREMVDMITLSRAYEANQKMIEVQDQSLNRAVNDLGRKS